MNIVVKNLTKKYGDKTVLNNFNITFKSEEISVIMGVSGVGKTTLLNCIANLTPYEGEIEGVEGVSYVFQEDRLINHLTVYENLDFALSGSLSKEERQKRIKDILLDVELTEKASAFPRELSGGQKKRVALARAFLSPQNLLLMDEPLSSLDMGLKSRVINLILKLKNKYNKTVITVTHDIEDGLSMADKISVVGYSGEVYGYVFSENPKNRDIYGEECNRIRREISNFLK